MIGLSMSKWQEISLAPLDGTEVKTGRRSPYLRGEPLYPITSRFIDGKWQAWFGDRWAPYDPQPDIWRPIDELDKVVAPRRAVRLLPRGRCSGRRSQPPTS